ncbi:MAG: class A beta-lactamase-related serine hydrolase [Defluviitaleaceae bacterium]|nr:class A beta-lactamase-related serine hydrolase [Defluviitaleaceae bacterium]
MQKANRREYFWAIAAGLMFCMFVIGAALNFFADSPETSDDVFAEAFAETDMQSYSPEEIPVYIETLHLDEFFSRFGSDIGVYFHNLTTGFVYSFNENEVFFGASLNKAKHALYTYVAAERGYISMSTVHTFTAEDFWGGTGSIRFRPAGTRFTTRELLKHSVVYSDNIAFRMLVEYMNGISFSYRDFVIETGANPNFLLDDFSQNTSASDTALWFYAINAYTRSDGRYTRYLRNDLLNTARYSHPYFTRGGTFGGDYNINVQFLHSDYPVAQKYGWSNRSFNTAGIVYARSPFILVIVSRMYDGAHDLFEEISHMMTEFNAEVVALH